MHLKMVTVMIITMLIMIITTVVVWMMLMKRPVTHLPYIIPVMESMLFLAPPLFLPSPIHDDIHHHHSFYYQHPQHPNPRAGPQYCLTSSFVSTTLRLQYIVYSRYGVNSCHAVNSYYADSRQLLPHY